MSKAMALAIHLFGASRSYERCCERLRHLIGNVSVMFSCANPQSSTSQCLQRHVHVGFLITYNQNSLRTADELI